MEHLYPQQHENEDSSANGGADGRRNAPTSRNPLSLSPQEVNVLRLLADGIGTAAIAGELQVDPRTIQNYITSLRRKTGCGTRVELAKWYQRSRVFSILTPPELNIVKLIVDELERHAIAEALQLDLRTVQNYIVSIRRKTGCRTRAELVQWYRQACT